MLTANDHVFVVCAYDENPFLIKCVKSLISQNCKSKIYMSTSTPNQYINDICNTYNIHLFINEEKKGIAHDWNFAYNQVFDKRLITLAHQDDIYEPDYLENILNTINKSNSPLILFTDYYEIRNNKIINNNKLLFIKRFMTLPFILAIFQKSIKMRRFMLSFGNPICCPSVTYVNINLPTPLFDCKYNNNCDYKLYIILSRLKGSFIYCPKKLVGHRIYSNSETSKNINDNTREKEDLEILNELWPKFIAKIIIFFYKLSENSNKID